MDFLPSGRRVFARLCILFAAVLAGAGGSLLGVCGPFTDVSDPAFCPFILEIFTLGITTGTTPTTYDPSGNVSRIQMAAFLSRTVDRTLQRGGRRAALDQFATPGNPANLGLTTVGLGPLLVRSDGLDLWVANNSSASVSRVRASDGRLLESWTASGAYGVQVAMGRVFVTGLSDPGKLYRIDPSQPAGAATIVVSTLPFNPSGIAWDGTRIWTANGAGSVSIVTPGPTIPWSAATVTTGFLSPGGLVYDGSNVWVSNSVASTLLKVNGSGAVLQTVTLGDNPQFPVFDGTSIWVPRFNGPSVTVVRASTGAVLATLTGNGLNNPVAAAFDGQRILVTNNDAAANSVSLWKAADLTPLGSFSTGPATHPFGACSDGVNFWITLQGSNQLARF